MKRLLSVTAVLCLMTSVGMSDDDRAKDHVFDSIDQMLSERQTMNKKFAAVYRGELIRFGDRPATMALVFYARAVDAKRKLDLQASFNPVPSPNGDIESGIEYVREGTTWKARRSGELFVHPYSLKPKGASVKGWEEGFHSANVIDPYDDFMLGYTGLEGPSDYQGIEMLYLGRARLIDAKRGLANRLVSRWDVPNPLGKMITTVEQSPKHGMPLRVSTKVQNRKNTFWDMKIEWQDHKDRWLPHRIKASKGDINNGPKRTEQTLLCRWLVGDEVPDAVFESDDHLAALFEALNLPNSLVVEGVVVRGQYTLPKNLIEDRDRSPSRRKPTTFDGAKRDDGP